MRGARRDLADLPALEPGLGSLRHRQLIERALDRRDQARGHARVARRGLQLLVAEQRLDRSDIGAAIEQVRRERVPERVQRHLLLDAGGGERLLEQPRDLSSRQVGVVAPAGEQPALTDRHALVIARAADQPPLAHESIQLRRQHHVPVFAPLALLHADDVQRGVDVADLELDGLADAQAGAVADRQQHARLQVAGHGDEPRRLLGAQDLRDPRRLLDVVDLVGQIEPTHGDAEQEPEARHRAIARLDRGARRHQVQLEGSHLVDGGRVGRSLQPGCEPPAGADVADLRAPRELARDHVLDHALAER